MDLVSTSVYSLQMTRPRITGNSLQGRSLNVDLSKQITTAEVSAKVASATTTKYVCNQIKGAVLIWFQISILVPFSCELQQVVKSNVDICIYKTRNETKALFIQRKDMCFKCRKQHVFGKKNVTSAYTSNAPKRKNSWFGIYIAKPCNVSCYIK